MTAIQVNEIIARYGSQAVLAAAEVVLQTQVRTGPVFSNPDQIKQWLKVMLAGSEREHFVVLYLDCQHRLIEHNKMFSGTVNSTTVYPREIVRRALEVNASALIVAHNHPSGCLDASNADRSLTKTISSVASTLDIRLLDHIIVSNEGAMSFAEKGLL